MNMKRLSVLGAVAVGLMLVGCGGVEAEQAEPVEAVETQEQSMTYPQCCASINRQYSEAFCDSVSFSADRCNQVYGGTACRWTC